MNLREEYERETGDKAMFDSGSWCGLPTPGYFAWLERRVADERSAASTWKISSEGHQAHAAALEAQLASSQAECERLRAEQAAKVEHAVKEIKEVSRGSQLNEDYWNGSDQAIEECIGIVESIFKDKP